MLNLSIFSPFHVSVSYLAPASSAYWQSVSLEEYVDFDVVASAFAVPGTFALFHLFTLSCTLSA